ncbi:hypothetical protein MJO28_000256 [Puccinia striiformis f. sp. tritici]|uniref:UDP-N-acetylglucosamine transferase subunit ALG13 n=2 Tax=Puccinia striiformis TaxID=27350 RepID=A0A2S4V0J4_9BASI|nr:hypothetical protein MJO28_000256 [Puccinia striiformis f. sp. tritici]KAI7967697.1 hypothetical protein MJO29_000974 [Puccinia striiformis f. sp. tritici]KAI9600809.1 hypothetical protein H4Q26_000602 [Puccinia striiformis f. sp. tritici PST-130]POW03021.1 hypothetical protein PSTT_11367 [Puccinia striiformis]
MLLIVITVGSTHFRPLINSILTNQHQEFINTLLSSTEQEKEFTRVLIQIGNHQLTEQTTRDANRFNQGSISHVKLNPTGKLELIIFKYSESIDRLLSHAQLIITHAGAGSILSAIKPIQIAPTATRLIKVTPDYSLDIDDLNPARPKPRVIIVPNPELMDNHQVDLADEISNLGLAFTCSIEQLIPTIREALNPQHSVPLHSDHVDILHGPTKFKNLLDQEMGFSSFED